MDALRRFWRGQSRKARLGVLLFSSTMFLCACSIIVLIVAEDREGAPVVVEQTLPRQEEWAATPAVDPAAPPEGTALSYYEIRRRRAVLTDEGWGRYARGLVGTRVEWAGYVANASPRGELAMEMDPLAGPSAIADVYLSVSPEEAATLAVDRIAFFTGVIRRITDARGEVTVVLRDGAIVR